MVVQLDKKQACYQTEITYLNGSHGCSQGHKNEGYPLVIFGVPAGYPGGTRVYIWGTLGTRSKFESIFPCLGEPSVRVDVFLL